MMKTKRLIALFMTVAFSLCMGVVTLGAETTYTNQELGLTLTLPQGTYVFTPETPDDDPSWKEAGLSDSVKFKTEYNTIGTLAHFSANGGKTNVYLGKKESETNKNYFNLGALTPDQRETFLGTFQSKEGDIVTSVGVMYPHQQVPFIKVQVESAMPEAVEQGVAHETLYFTIVNGYSVSFSQHGPTAISDTDTRFMEALVNSATFANLQPRPELAPADYQQAILAVVMIGVFIVAVIVAIVVYKMNIRRRKNAIKRLADRLSTYRKQRGEKDYQQGESLFENITDHSDAAIGIYSKYYTYVKKPVGPVVCILVCLGGAIGSVILQGEWWMSLLMGAAAVFCTYRFVTAGAAMQKAQRRVYSNLRSRKARYGFYKDEFTISGTQSAGSYPYFQISALDEWKNYFYLYFGEGNAHYVAKDSFTKGDAESFKKFLENKIKSEGGRR